MQELRTLESWMESMSLELKTILQRKKTLEYLMSRKGYSIKKIRGNYYLYVWKTTGHARARWKCLGNLLRLGGLLAVESIRQDRVDALLQEYVKLTQREEEIRALARQVIEVLEEAHSKDHVEMVT